MPQPFSAEFPALSVIMPVRNEERHLADAVNHVLAQDYPGPVEVVLAIAPSTDRTGEVAAQLAAHNPKVRLVDNPSGTTPDGLNAAIEVSAGEVIARVDGHAEIPGNYLRTAVRALAESGAANVGGVMAAEGVTPFERAVAAAMTSRLGVGGAAFHTGGQAGPALTVYLGVFRREALREVGGYDPHFLRAQDWEMNHRLRQAGKLVWFDPTLRVTYRPRPTVAALARQYRDYGRWRRVVARRHRGTASARYLAPPAMVVGTTAATVLGFVVPLAWIVPLGYLGAVTVGGWWISRAEPLAVRARVPLALATMHWSWGWGFLSSPPSLAAPPSPGQIQAPGPRPDGPNFS